MAALDAAYAVRLAPRQKWGRDMLDRIRPVPGRGSGPTHASCCAQLAIVEYWRCDALGQQSALTCG